MVVIGIMVNVALIMVAVEDVEMIEIIDDPDLQFDVVLLSENAQKLLLEPEKDLQENHLAEAVLAHRRQHGVGHAEEAHGLAVDRLERLLGVGGSKDPLEAYRDFRGRDADVAPLLARRRLA